MLLTFDATSTSLSFVCALSIVIGLEMIHTSYNQFTLNKTWDICISSLLFWGTMFQLIPYVIYFCIDQNASVLIMGYPLSILFMALYHCGKLYSRFHLHHSLRQDLSAFQPARHPSLHLVNSLTTEEKEEKHRINFANDTRKNTIDVYLSDDESKNVSLLTLKQGGMYWILCLNHSDHKPMGYMTCNNDGYCYNNCEDSQKSLFEIVYNDSSVDIIAFWGNVSDGTRASQKISMKETGHFGGYVGMWSNGDIENKAWQLVSADTLAENGYKIKYFVDGIMNGWLGCDKESKWCKIVTSEAEAGVYVLGRH